MREALRMSTRLDELGVAGYFDADARERLADLDVDAVHTIGIAGAITPELLLRIHELGPTAVAEFAYSIIAGPLDPDDLQEILKHDPAHVLSVAYASGKAPFDNSRQVVDLLRQA